MKVKLIAILLFSCAVSIHAQRFGIRGGVNIDNSSIEYNGLDADTRVGFHVGAVSEFDITQNGLLFNAALLYSQNGFTFKYDMGNNTGQTYHFKTNNLELPLHIRKEFAISPTIKPFVQAGPYFSYALSGRIKMDKSSSMSMEFDKGGDRFDVGANIGVGCNVVAGLRLLANYGYGFTDNKIVLGSQYVKNKNRRWTVSAEYLF